MQLGHDWKLGRLHLNTEEAIDLLLSIAIAEQMSSLVFLRQLGPIKRKVIAAFSDTFQSQIRDLRKRIFIGPPAPEPVLSTFNGQRRESIRGVAKAFFERHRLVIAYVGENGIPTTREVDPQFLYLSPPVWYILAWDHHRDAVRTFRIDRMRSVTMSDARFRLDKP